MPMIATVIISSINVKPASGDFIFSFADDFRDLGRASNVDVSQDLCHSKGRRSAIAEGPTAFAAKTLLCQRILETGSAVPRHGRRSRRFLQWAHCRGPETAINSARALTGMGWENSPAGGEFSRKGATCSAPKWIAVGRDTGIARSARKCGSRRVETVSPLMVTSESPSGLRILDIVQADIGATWTTARPWLPPDAVTTPLMRL